MKQRIKYKLIILVLVPFLMGQLINLLISYAFRTNNSLMFTASDTLLTVWTFASVIYWYWVGKQFGSLSMKKVKSFILGNVVWGISLVLYVWQFLFVDGVHRNLFIAGISQNYMLGFVSWSAKLIGIFTNSIDSTQVTIGAYLLMLIIYAVGFKRNIMSTNCIKSRQGDSNVKK